MGVCITLLCSTHSEAATKKTPAKPAASATQAPPKGTISKDPYVGAVVIDAASGQVLFEDQADAKAYPASVLKLMDLLIILERIEARQLSHEDQVQVSARASGIGGSQVWLMEKETVKLDDLLYALMIPSANDAAVALAEKVAGTTEAFVQLMNKRAKELGMQNTVFNSVHGLPPGKEQEPDVTTARDFAILCRELAKHPDVFRFTSTRERPFQHNNGKTIEMRTHNHLLSTFQGCDGLKTGYFTRAGYSIAATAKQNERRLIAVVLGSTTWQRRDAKTRELLAKCFAATPVPAPSSAGPAATGKSGKK